MLFALTAPLVHADENGPSRAQMLAATCANCHGTDGQALGAMPALAGRPAEYTLTLLQLFRENQIPTTIMHQIVKGYSAEELQLIAEHLAQQEPRP